MKLTKNQKKCVKLSRDYHARMHQELVDKFLSGYLTMSQLELYCSDTETPTLKVLRLEKERKIKEKKLRYNEIVNNSNHFNELLYSEKARKALLEEELERINMLPADSVEQRKFKVIQRNKILYAIEEANNVITKITEALNETKRKHSRPRGRPKNTEKFNPAIEEDSTIETEEIIEE